MGCISGREIVESFNTLRWGQSGSHFADDIFNLFNKNCYVLSKISLKFVPSDPINDNGIGPDNGLVLKRQQAIVWTNPFWLKLYVVTHDLPSGWSLSFATVLKNNFLILGHLNQRGQSSRMDFMLRLPNCTDRHQMLIILTNSTSDIWILRLTKQTCWRDFGKTVRVYCETYTPSLPEWWPS